MAIDRFISNRLNGSSSRDKPTPPKKEATLGSKLFSAAKSLEKFLLFNHVREGRMVSALLTASSLTLSDMVTRKSKKRPKRQSVLAHRRANPRKAIIQPKTAVKRRKPRSITRSRPHSAVSA